MKTLAPLLACAAIGLLLLLKPPVAAAYTISVDCQENNLSPPGRPYPNADCFYSWQQGGDPLHLYGEVVFEVLWYRALNGEPGIKLDERRATDFNLLQTPSPMQAWLQCTNLAGSYRLGVVGYLKRLIIGGVNGPGGISTVQVLTDNVNFYVTNPVPCP